MGLQSIFELFMADSYFVFRVWSLGDLTHFKKLEVNVQTKFRLDQFTAKRKDVQLDFF